MIGAGIVLLGLAACGSPPARNDSAEASAEPANEAAPTPTPAPTPAASIVLEGAGLRLAGASPRTIGFETSKAETIEALTGALGRAPGEVGENGECGGGGGMQFAAWKDDLTLWFDEGGFAGWDSKGKLKTLDGVGIGSSRADVAALPGFEIEQSTLGTEFRAGGLSGILASKAPGAKVTALWGGATCVFR